MKDRYLIYEPIFLFVNLSRPCVTFGAQKMKELSGIMVATLKFHRILSNKFYTKTKNRFLRIGLYIRSK